MERRKFLIGAGSLAAGSAAAMGTGAFNFANVERDISVNVADDSAAFLALSTDSEYADDSGQKLALTFDESAGPTGEGVNADSGYSFRSIFTITNQGSNSVGVWINDDDTNDAVSWYAAPGFSTSIEGAGSPYALDPGESVDVNVVIITENGDNLPESINVVADQSQGNSE